MIDIAHSFEIETKNLFKVKVNDLEIGMYVSELDRPWLETSFLFQGFKIETEDHLKILQSQCEYVYIDVSKQESVF